MSQNSHTTAITKAPKNPATRSDKPATTWFTRHRWAVLLGVFALVAGGNWFLLEYVVWNRLPPVLVGKWVVVGGEQDGATFDFYRSGAMVGKINVGGREGIVNARVRLEGDKLYSTTRNPHTGADETRVQTIRTLTDRLFVLEDDRGKRFSMERAE
jgi:uncharacterized protein (TIGR03066 family)